ncbi:hypothetical protein BGW80DRAFT_1442315 [Lactifluus volemus]|nr:hypothetical protein BGW80DRAFT_1442315 [Lactifluus volemus]
MNHSFLSHIISRSPSNDITITVTTQEFLMLQLVSTMIETFFFGLYTALFAFSTLFTLSVQSHEIRPVGHFRGHVRNLCDSLVSQLRHYNPIIKNRQAHLHGNIGCRVPTIIQRPGVDPSAHKLILGDGIVLWRAWILWDRRIMLFILPFLSLVCTLVFIIVDIIFVTDGLITHSMRHVNTGGAFGVAAWGLTIGTNIWATSLMFIRAWQHRRFLRSVFDKENAKSKGEKTLAFLVESGAIYICILVADIMIAACGSASVIALSNISIQLVGIYPTAIVVVITMRLSAADILSRPGGESHPYSTPIVFIPRSPTLQISEAGLNDSDTENGRKMTSRQDL